MVKTAIYGRRRVGKSFLVDEAFRGKLIIQKSSSALPQAQVEDNINSVIKKDRKGVIPD